MLDAFGGVESSPLLGVVRMRLGIFFEAGFLGFELGEEGSIFLNKLFDASVELGLKSEIRKTVSFAGYSQ